MEQLNFTWAVYVLVAVLGYFLRDAHQSFKSDLKKKADQEAMDHAFEMYRADMRSQEERHKEDIDRIERQYEIKFAGVVAQFNERMNGMEKNLFDRMNGTEKNLSERMDLILQLMHRSQK